MSVSLDQAKEASEQARQANLRDNDAGISEEHQFDYEEYDAPIVQGHPEVLVTFDHIAGFSPFNTSDDFLDAKQNLQGAGPQGYGNDLMLVLANPTVVEGEVWTVDDNDFKDFKLLGGLDDDRIHYERQENVIREDGEVKGAETTGVDLGMADFDGQPTGDGLSDYDYVQILIPSHRAEHVLGALDTAGKWSHTQDGEFTEGILEAPPNFGTDDYDADSDPAPRAIGYPELRADMDGQQGAIAWTFGVDDDESTSRNTRVNLDVYKIVEGDDGEATLAALTPLTTDDDAYAKPTYPRRNGCYWEHDSDGDASEGDHGADAEPETDDGVADAQEMMSDGDTPSYESLTDAGQEFVDEAVGVVESMDVGSIEDVDEDAGTPYESFAARVEQTAGENVQASADALAAIIDERAA